MPGRSTTRRVRRIDRLVITGQHTDCRCRRTSDGAFTRGIEIVVAADATAVCQPFTSGRYQQARDGALRYLRTYYGADHRHRRPGIAAPCYPCRRDLA